MLLLGLCPSDSKAAFYNALEHMCLRLEIYHAGVSTQAKAALSAASEATSGVQAAASDALQSLNQATSGVVDQAGAVFKDLSGGVSEVTSSLQVLFILNASNHLVNHTLKE